MGRGEGNTIVVKLQTSVPTGASESGGWFCRYQQVDFEHMQVDFEHTAYLIETCETVASAKSSRGGLVVACFALSTTEKALSESPVGREPEAMAMLCFFMCDVRFERGREAQDMEESVHIVVFSVAGMIANRLFKFMPGESVRPIVLHLLGSERSRHALEGAVELEDSLFPLLSEVNKLHSPSMDRADLLNLSGQIFAQQGH